MDKRDKIGVQIYIWQMYIQGFFSLGHEVMKKKDKKFDKTHFRSFNTGQKKFDNPLSCNNITAYKTYSCQKYWKSAEIPVWALFSRPNVERADVILKLFKPTETTHT